MPGVASYTDLVSVIRNGDKLIRGLSEIRLTDIRNRFGEHEFIDGGYLERIDLFDNDYFGIVPQESLRMDPDQRLMLEYALKAIYNAGYNEKYVRENNVGFYSIHEGYNYRAFFDDDSHLSLSAHLTGMSLTRVANFLDIRGPVVGFHTSCSSSLTAFHHACLGLINEECDVALVGGAKLNVVLREAALNSPVLSRSNKCLPFDNAADGTLIGEGVICMVLKKLEKAELDRDFIYAVISGSAINHGGNRLSNLTAPSEEAQSEVLIKAWKNAKINPADIGFIEAHGTGTILGDPIEYAGIVNAFARSGTENYQCSISSVKGQMGHLDTLSGMAGLLRAIIAIRENILPKQVGFSKANSFLKLNEGVRIQEETQKWITTEDKIRTAGVSSFGLTGTNVHVVLEESKAITQAPDAGPLLLNIAWKSEIELQKNAAYIADYAEFYKIDLRSFCGYMNRIFSTGEFRKSIFFTTRLEMIAGLRDPGKVVSVQPKIILYMIFSTITTFTKTDIRALTRSSQGLSEIWNEFFLKSGLKEDLFDTKSSNVLFLYLLVSYIKSGSNFSLNLIFLKEGSVIESLFNQSFNIRELLNTRFEASEKSFNEEKFKTFVESIDELKGHRIILTDDKNGKVRQLFSDAGKEFIHLCDDPGQFLLIQSLLFKAGCKRDLTDEPMSSPLEIPLPVLNHKRFWPTSRQLNTSGPVADTAKTTSSEIVDIPSALKEIWKEQIGIEQIIGDEEDFFEIGGNSLIGLDVLAIIEKKMGVRLNYQDIFEYPTISSLSHHIQEIKNKNSTAVTGEIKLQPSSMPGTDRHTRYEKLLKQIDQLDAVEEIKPARIMITGATGFLGIFIVKELLEKTGAKILCLVRASSDEEANERFMNVFLHYFPDDQVLVKERVHVIRGDVTLENLGLNMESLELFDGIDSIYHLAANVAHFGKYSVSDKINNKGTRLIFDWAKKIGAKQFNHFSTLAVIGSNIPGLEVFDFHEFDLNVGQEFGSQIYSRSKFLAEEHILENGTDGIEYNIFRTGSISGATGTGFFQKNIDKNNTYLAFKTIATLGFFPKEFLSQTTEMLPVDIVASAIADLSLHRNNLLKVYHLFNTNPYTFAEVINAMNLEGIRIKTIPLSEFQQAVSNVSDFSDLTTLGMARYGSNNDSGTTATTYHIHQEASRRYMQKINSPIGFDREEYIRSVIRFCIVSNFISTDQYIKTEV